MIYLIHENEDINEITLIYYVKPSEDIFYKEIEEKDLPLEKDGYHRKLFYNKVNDTVYAEYEEVEEEKTEIDLLKEELDNSKLELSLAIVELTEQLNSSK